MFCSANAEQYEEAARQFRDDVAVNPADTEEAIWAFLSEAKIIGLAKARQQFLQVASSPSHAVAPAISLQAVLIAPITLITIIETCF